ncbi:MAG: glycosyltransferase family 2 protein [Candidatus Omnitrophica bacterium]|nr:glycosyltransferase family 2 protein [Candidatus Omnitrophota bacterium]
MYLENSGIEMIKAIVLIPSYNGSKTIGAIIRRIKALGLQACIVDDGSTDNTGSIAEQEGASVLRHEKNKGKGASLREGFRHIFEKDFDAVLVMDGDGQHDTGDIEHFFKKMDQTGADIVIGNRMSDTSSMPLSRKATNRIMSYTISKLCGLNIPDTQCGFKLIKRKVLENIDLESSNYEIESEILLKAARIGYKIESVPIRTVYRGERSNINPIIDTLRFLMFIIKVLV